MWIITSVEYALKHKIPTKCKNLTNMVIMEKSMLWGRRDVNCKRNIINNARFSQPSMNLLVNDIRITLTYRNVFVLFHFILCCLSGSGSLGQQPEHGDPDVPLPGHQLLLRDTETFPSQPSDMICPVSPWFAPGTPPGWACPK